MKFIICAEQAQEEAAQEIVDALTKALGPEAAIATFFGDEAKAKALKFTDKQVRFPHVFWGPEPEPGKLWPQERRGGVAALTTMLAKKVADPATGKAPARPATAEDKLRARVDKLTLERDDARKALAEQQHTTVELNNKVSALERALKDREEGAAATEELLQAFCVRVRRMGDRAQVAFEALVKVGSGARMERRKERAFNLANSEVTSILLLAREAPDLTFATTAEQPD